MPLIYLHNVHDKHPHRNVFIRLLIALALFIFAGLIFWCDYALLP